MPTSSIFTGRNHEWDWLGGDAGFQRSGPPAGPRAHHRPRRSGHTSDPRSSRCRRCDEQPKPAVSSSLRSDTQSPHRPRQPRPPAVTGPGGADAQMRLRTAGTRPGVGGDQARGRPTCAGAARGLSRPVGRSLRCRRSRQGSPGRKPSGPPGRTDGRKPRKRRVNTGHSRPGPAAAPGSLSQR